MVLTGWLLGYAQVSNETVPISWVFPSTVEGTVWHNLSFIEPTGLLAEDALISKSEPLRFAKSRSVNISPSTHGRWSNLSNGDRIWKLGIHCMGSFSVGLLFSSFSIPQGARLYIYSEDLSQHLGPFTKNDNRTEDEILVTPPIYGDKLIVEYYEPYAYRGQGSFHLQSVQHGYRDLRSMVRSDEDECIETLTTNASNSHISTSVLMMVVDNGQKIATGTLLNNTSGNSKPYLLTSRNALKGNPGGWVFLFDVTSHECLERNNCWSTAVCGGSPVSVDSIQGTALIALRSTPPRNWSIFYSGWNTNMNETVSGYKSIQHAGGFYQSISTYNGNLPTVTWNGLQTKKVVNWNSGGTDQASIGSPLFDASNNLVGVYVGGDLDCEGNGADYFVSFSSSFHLYNAFLDPIQSGIVELGGIYPVVNDNTTGSSDFDVTFFPNPAKNWIYTKVANESEVIKEIQIYDAQGRAITKIIPQTPTVDLGELPEGIYMIQFLSGNKVCTQKLLIR